MEVSGPGTEGVSLPRVSHHQNLPSRLEAPVPFWSHPVHSVSGTKVAVNFSHWIQGWTGVSLSGREISQGVVQFTHNMMSN